MDLYINKASGEVVKITEKPVRASNGSNNFYLVYEFDKTFKQWRESYYVSKGNHAQFLENHVEVSVYEPNSNTL